MQFQSGRDCARCKKTAVVVLARVRLQDYGWSYKEVHLDVLCANVEHVLSETIIGG